MRPPRRNPGRVARRPAVWAVALLALVGCKPNKRYDLIEAELRTRDRELAETRLALEQARTLNRAYEQSRGPQVPGGPVPVPTGAPAGCPVRSITLGRGTGGVDDDGAAGDESLMVVIVPADEDKSAVKVPASASVVAWQVDLNGIKTPIGSWEIPADRLRPTWRSGLLATGYFVPLQWQTYPTADRVRVAVRLTTTDGRAFEADRDVTVRPVVPAMPTAAPPAGPRQPLLPGAPPAGVPAELPPGTEELPPPTGMPTGRGARLLPPVRQ
ncbi:MAG: hypothetical protein K2X87_33055 [Gemmataceae bacterium]|nr:hypothetical protein [Gemmataceae bacterium]